MIEIFVRIVENPFMKSNGHLKDIKQCVLGVREIQGIYQISKFCVITNELVRI